MLRRSGRLGHLRHRIFQMNDDQITRIQPQIGRFVALIVDKTVARAIRLDSIVSRQRNFQKAVLLRTSFGSATTLPIFGRAHVLFCCALAAGLENATVRTVTANKRLSIEIRRRVRVRRAQVDGFISFPPTMVSPCFQGMALTLDELG